MNPVANNPFANTVLPSLSAPVTQVAPAIMVPRDLPPEGSIPTFPFFFFLHSLQMTTMMTLMKNLTRNLKRKRKRQQQRKLLSRNHQNLPKQKQREEKPPPLPPSPLLPNLRPHLPLLSISLPLLLPLQHPVLPFSSFLSPLLLVLLSYSQLNDLLVVLF